MVSAADDLSSTTHVKSTWLFDAHDVGTRLRLSSVSARITTWHLHVEVPGRVYQLLQACNHVEVPWPCLPAAATTSRSPRRVYQLLQLPFDEEHFVQMQALLLSEGKPLVAMLLQVVYGHDHGSHSRAAALDHMDAHGTTTSRGVSACSRLQHP